MPLQPGSGAGAAAAGVVPLCAAASLASRRRPRTTAWGATEPAISLDRERGRGGLVTGAGRKRGGEVDEAIGKHVHSWEWKTKGEGVVGLNRGSGGVRACVGHGLRAFVPDLDSMPPSLASSPPRHRRKECEIRWRMGETHGGGRGAVEVCGGGRRRSDEERRRWWIQGVHGGEPRRQGVGTGIRGAFGRDPRRGKGRGGGVRRGQATQ